MVNARAPLQLMTLSHPGSLHANANSVALRGSLAVITALDLIQWLCTQQQSWTLCVFGQPVEANFTVVGGELVDVRWGPLSGYPALVEMLQARQGEFDLQPVGHEYRRTLHGPWQRTLLTAVQMIDERRAPQKGPDEQPGSAVGHKRRSSESGEHTFTNAFPPDTARSSGETASLKIARNAATLKAPQLIDQGFVALREGRIETARALWTEALLYDPDNRALQFNLKKLESRTA